MPTSLTRRSFLGSAPLAFLSAQQASQRPNIVLIIADDLAAWMLGCYGNKEIRTPNIDNLARGGQRFINSFVATPICSPSRATLFTGRLPSQHGIYDFLTARPADNPPQGQAAPPPSFDREVMLPEILADAGYRCAFIGKWHMGNDEKPGRGFEHTVTMIPRKYDDPTLHVDGTPVEHKGFLTEIKTKYACDFIERQTPERPFFLTISYLNPHTPYTGHPARYYDMYSGVKFDTIGWEPAAPNALREKEYLDDIVGNIRKCAASVTALDDQIPVLQRKLAERGLTANTLIIFTGDNGFLLGRHGLWSKGHASDPINMYEEVMQVPMIWNWPGRIPVQSTRPELVSFYDFLPTVCEAVGVGVPSGRNLVGRSYFPLVLNRQLPRRQPWPGTVFGQFRYTEMARDNRFKLVLRHNGEGPNELFDLRSDPREKVNQYDNPRFVTVRDRLAGELAVWRKRVSA